MSHLILWLIACFMCDIYLTDKGTSLTICLQTHSDLVNVFIFTTALAVVSDGVRFGHSLNQK